jgi:hypothetical protein
MYSVQHLWIQTVYMEYLRRVHDTITETINQTWRWHTRVETWRPRQQTGNIVVLTGVQSLIRLQLNRMSDNPDRNMKNKKWSSHLSAYLKRHVAFRKADEFTSLFRQNLGQFLQTCILYRVGGTCMVYRLHHSIVHNLLLPTPRVGITIIPLQSIPTPWCRVSGRSVDASSPRILADNSLCLPSLEASE